MTSRIKVYELAKELGIDSQHLVDVVQRLGIDIKNSMSQLGSEEVRTVRDYYKKQKPLAKSTAAAQQGKSSPVTEKRVGATVIRRRAGGSAKSEPLAADSPPPISAKQESVEEIEESTLQEAQDALEEEVVEIQSEETDQTEAEEVEVEAEADVEVEAEPEAVEEADEVTVQPEPAPSAPISASKTPVMAKAPAAPPKPRRLFPSIIKKVATEQYLGEKVGPKVERKERPKTPTSTTPAGQRPKPTTGPARPGTTPAPTGQVGLRRVKEVEMGPVTDAAKEAQKRRLAEGQTTVFKRADFLKRELVHAMKKKKNVVNRPALKTQITKPAEHKRVVEMGDTILVSELAKQMGLKATVVVAKLMGLGVTASINQSVDHDTASLVAPEFGFEVKHVAFREEDYLPKVDLAPESLKPRPPVVTIMGHVDHGKTSLLDAIRKTKVAAGEAGGITQHIGAYTVDMPKGKITFIDTPGHEAFTAMRARGAKVTDIVIIVVSAVDGVMPQTLESISHAQAANVHIIVAINKCDLPDANPDRVKQTLAGHNLAPEEWGGNTIYVNVSAKTGSGLDKLLESVLLVAELAELKANYDVPARGAVIESSLDKFRGPVATVLVQHGKLVPGSLVVCGTAIGKIRAMTDYQGKKVAEALPSYAVEILGLSEVPVVGDDLMAVSDEKSARDLTSNRVDVKRALPGVGRAKMSLEDMLAAPDGDKELRIVLKADVQGSAEALKESLLKIPSAKVKLKMLHFGSGGVTESDVMLASASGAVILGFNIRPDIKAQKLADQEKVHIRTYNIIYDLLDDVKKLMEGLLDKIVKERVIGRAEVRDVFHIPKVGAVAGSAVIDGKVVRGCYLRLLRDSRVVYEGKLSSLRRFKEDVKEVSSGFECGIALENFNDVKQGDQFEAFLKEETQGTL